MSTSFVSFPFVFHNTAHNLKKFYSTAVNQHKPFKMFTRIAQRHFAQLARLTLKPNSNFGVSIEDANAKQLGHILQKAAAGYQTDWMPAAFRALDVIEQADAKDIHRWFTGFFKAGVLQADVGGPLLSVMSKQLMHVSGDLRIAEIVEFAGAAADLVQMPVSTSNSESMELRMQAIPQIFATISASFLHRCQAAPPDLLIDLADSFARARIQDPVLFNKISLRQRRHNAATAPTKNTQHRL